MVRDEEMPTYAEMCDLNPGFDRLDYIAFALQQSKLHFDFLTAFSGLFVPKFILVDGRVQIEGLFNREQYDGLIASGCALEEAQMWCSLTEFVGVIDAAFPDTEVDLKDIVDFCQSLVDVWNLQLEAQGYISCGRAQLEVDEELGEVYVFLK
ncbi:MULTISPECIES: hypothetical protein [Thalassospira]|uniref:hypothetical protein n=1 Tax=Thalassospira TaxID=168934 RepID=UPI001D1820F3|nr:hypothetical protein [Thalassospira povalilytica]MCC4242503.1 hypothetical protein [Thalassospira povalilytica]